MARDTFKCEITAKGTDSVTVRTAKGRLSYPYLFSPNKDDKYSTSLVFPKGADLSALSEATDLAAKLLFGPDYAKKYPKLKTPFLKTAESPAMGVSNPEEFPVFIRTSTKADPNRPGPGVVNHQMAPAEPGDVYPGRWAMLTIVVKAYDRDGNKGVTCYLNNVQVLEHDDRFGGGSRPASDDFEAVPVSDSADAMFRA